jgi:hypothetical protein
VKLLEAREALCAAMALAAFLLSGKRKSGDMCVPVGMWESWKNCGSVQGKKIRSLLPSSSERGKGSCRFVVLRAFDQSTINVEFSVDRPSI